MLWVHSVVDGVLPMKTVVSGLYHSIANLFCNFGSFGNAAKEYTRLFYSVSKLIHSVFPAAVGARASASKGNAKKSAWRRPAAKKQVADVFAGGAPRLTVRSLQSHTTVKGNFRGFGPRLSLVRHHRSFPARKSLLTAALSKRSYATTSVGDEDDNFSISDNVIVDFGSSR